MRSYEEHLCGQGLDALVRDWNYDDMTDVNQNAIEVRVDDIAQLFHTLDPFPFRDRDLDRHAI
jgi:hypothetical protein